MQRPPQAVLVWQISVGVQNHEVGQGESSPMVHGTVYLGGGGVVVAKLVVTGGLATAIEASTPRIATSGYMVYSKANRNKIRGLDSDFRGVMCKSNRVAIAFREVATTGRRLFYQRQNRPVGLQQLTTAVVGVGGKVSQDNSPVVGTANDVGRNSRIALNP